MYKDGISDPNDIPAVRISEKDEKVCIRNNRRLKAFQDTGVEINYKNRL